MLTIETINDRNQWNETLRHLPCAHVLQSWEWGEFKQQTTGWQPQRLAFRRDGAIVAMASLGVRRVGPFRLMYVPRGPALAYEDEALTVDVLAALEKLAKQQGAVWLKIDPDLLAGTGVPGEDDVPYPPGQQFMDRLRARGWTFSNDQVQFRNSITIDLTRSEDEILASMSQNTRRKVRTASKKGVSIRAGDVHDLQTLYELYQVTGQRDDFLTRPFDYYRLAWRRFMEAGLAHPLIAEYEDQPIAHVILFHFGTRCWYFYGASSNDQRERMPNYALQWEAMRWAKQQGYHYYDMWGAPDIFDESDRMWGVYQFKRGFRGQVVRTVGAWDYAPNLLLYRAYTQLWPRLRALMR